jgi:hypothetical protein
MSFENEDELLKKVLEQAKLPIGNKFNHVWEPDKLEDLVKACWKSLDEKVKTAYLAGNNIVDNKKLNGLDDFIRSMQRSQNSFASSDIEDAKLNFKVLDKSNHTTEESIFKVGEIKTGLGGEKSLKAFTALPLQVATQLSSFVGPDRTDGERAKLTVAFTNILVGVVTNKNRFLHSRSVDKSKISQHGAIHPELVLAVANFVCDNVENLPTNSKDLKRLGTSFKKELERMDLQHSANKSNLGKPILFELTNIFNQKFKESNSKNRISVFDVDKDSRNIDDSTSTISSIESTPTTPASKRKGSGFFR